MRGLFDGIIPSPSSWVAEQRAAVSGDIAYQRAALTSDMRRVASEAATDVAIKVAIAGVATVAISLLAWKLATRGGR